MRRHRVIVGLGLLCCLAFSAMALQSASAATKGTTLFTCKKKAVEGGSGFSKEHCAAADKAETAAKFEHVEVKAETTTEIAGTTIDTSGANVTSKLESVISGVEEQITSKLAHVLEENEGQKSWVENAKDPTTGEHYYHGEAWLRYTEVSVTKPVGKSCVVKGGEVATKKLKFTSKGQGDELLFEPAAGTVFAEFTIEGCTIATLNGLYKVEGKVKVQPDGATVSTTLANTKAQGTLKLRGQTASFESSATIKGSDEAAGDKEDTPLSSTTTEKATPLSSTTEEAANPLSPTTVETP